MTRLSLLRMMLTQPVGPRELTPERHRGVAKVRLLIVLLALLGDAAFYALLRGDPRIDQTAPLLALARRESFPETPSEALAPTMQATGE